MQFFKVDIKQVQFTTILNSPTGGLRSFQDIRENNNKKKVKTKIVSNVALSILYQGSNTEYFRVTSYCIPVYHVEAVRRHVHCVFKPVGLQNRWAQCCTVLGGSKNDRAGKTFSSLYLTDGERLG